MRDITWEYRDEDSDVLYITNMWPDSDRPVYGIFVKRQVDSLRALGLRCDVLYVRGYYGPRTYLRAAVSLAAASPLFAERYRLVHAHAGETALISGGIRGLPTVASYCGDDLLGHLKEDGSISLTQRARRYATRFQALRYDATITKSREMETVLPRGARGTNLVLPNGVDQSVFRPMDRDEARRALGWPVDGRIVLFAATRPHEPRKRLPLAQAAVEQARRELGPITLFVAENQSPDQIPLLMNAADCLLHTSQMEGSPNVIKEAVMCNLPIVCTPSGDINEVLDGVEPSALCRADAAEIADGLMRVLSQAVRSNGREMRAELSDAVIARRLLALYESVGFTFELGKPVDCGYAELAS